MSILQPSFHDVHVLAANGVIQPELLTVVVIQFQVRRLHKGPPPLMSNVVYDKDGTSICHLAIVPIVCLGGRRQLASERTTVNKAAQQQFWRLEAYAVFAVPPRTCHLFMLLT